MKRRNQCGFMVLLGTLWLFSANAQTPAQAAQPLPKAPADVNIDGHLTEWSGSSFVSDNNSKLKYIISSDDNYLYLVADLDQRAIRQKVMGAGITLSVNTEGKKKRAFSFTYPVPVADETMSYVDKQHARQTHAKASGFKDVNDDLVLPDEHGFKAAFSFQEEGGAGYEIAIPFKALNMKPGTNSININIRVNGLDRPMESTSASSTTSDAGSRGGSRGGGGRGGSRSGSGSQLPPSTGAHDDTPADVYSTTDFWLTYTLPSK